MVEPTIADVLHAHARRHAEREALVFEGRRWTWGELRVRASRVANALRGRRLEPGDRVAVLSRNVSELWELFLGCALSGTVLCPINFRLVPEHDTVHGLVGYTGARLVFVGAEYEEFVREAIASLRLRAADVIALDRDFEEFLLGASDRPPEVTVAAEDPVAMLHTSGTTGDPKGAVISHRAWIWNGLTELTHVGLHGTDRVLQAMPLVHTGGLTWLTAATFVGGATLVLGRHWDPDELLQLIDRERCTHTWGQEAPLTRLLAEDVHRYDLRSLRTVYSAAGPNRRAWSSEVVARLGLERFLYTYGSTEAGLVSITTGTADTLEREGSVGWPVFTSHTRLVLEDGSDAPTGSPGELWVKSPAVFSGYHALPARTSRALSGGWYHTGDVLRRDADGCLYFLNRMDDMIKSGGENVSPLEVEQALIKVIPEVTEAAVVGVPDPTWTQMVVAFVVCPRGALDDATVRSRLRGVLAGYKIPKRVHFVEALPRDPFQGKVRRTELRRMAEEWRDRRSPG